MPKRLEHHFEPQKGWMNDPNGLVYFKGRYHAFFQHYPYKPQWGQMHWGHAVSSDLVSWEQLPIALYPDQAYEDDGGCFSGSAIEKEGRLYLFYTSVSHALGQTQSVAVSDDGVTFTKYEGNPVIDRYPEDGSPDFRDPKVIAFRDEYRMVVGSGKDGAGRVLLYRSKDLLSWEYLGVLFEDAALTPVMECPDLFRVGDEYVLMFSKMGKKQRATQFILGSFDGRKFTERARFENEIGPQFYAPQTFCSPDGRRIMIGWLYDWGKTLDEGATYAGALTLAREIRIENSRLLVMPVKEAEHLLTDEDAQVSVNGNIIRVEGAGEYACAREVESMRIIRDTKTMEIFVNSGEDVVTVWFGK